MRAMAPKIEESSEMFSQLCFDAQNIYTANEQVKSHDNDSDIMNRHLGAAD